VVGDGSGRSPNAGAHRGHTWSQRATSRGAHAARKVNDGSSAAERRSSATAPLDRIGSAPGASQWPVDSSAVRVSPVASGHFEACRGLAARRPNPRTRVDLPVLSPECTASPGADEEIGARIQAAGPLPSSTSTSAGARRRRFQSARGMGRRRAVELGVTWRRMHRDVHDAAHRIPLGDEVVVRPPPRRWDLHFEGPAASCVTCARVSRRKVLGSHGPSPEQ